MPDYVEQFTAHMTAMLQKISTQERVKIQNVAEKMAQCIADGRNVFVFGPGHAGIITEDFFYRAGGLAVVNPLFNPCVSPSIHPITLSTATEGLVGMATCILEQSPIRKGDLLLIHSVAARNPIVVEMALKAQKKGIALAAIINRDFAQQVTSRDPSGKMLQDIVPDAYVIDNCGELGDACMTVEGIEAKVASTSSISGTFIVACIVLDVCAALQKRGVDAPVYYSANRDGGAAKNEALMEKYKEHIFYM